MLDQLIHADPGRDVRQVGIVDSKGGSAAWSGQNCTDWFGHLTGDDFSVQGNMLVGARTIETMAEAFAATAGLTLAERLMAVLEAGQSNGGDKRGRQSAAMLVYKIEEYPYLSLRVDEHPYPVAELRRVFEVARCQLLPFHRRHAIETGRARRVAEGGSRHADDPAAIPSRGRRFSVTSQGRSGNTSTLPRPLLHARSVGGGRAPLHGR